MYVAGLDGGGTKTDVLVSDLDGNIIYRSQSGALNYNGESGKNIEENIKNIFADISIHAGPSEDCSAICIGTAGIGNIAAEMSLRQAVINTGYKCPLLIVGDHETALLGALNKSFGMILIAGTGSICHGKNASGKTHQTGGFGYLIDDEGSGYAIGRDVLSAVVRSYDGRMQETIMTELVLSHLKLSSVQEIVGFVYGKNTNKRDIAALSIILEQACREKDPAALGIADKCMTELTKLVVPVAEKLGLECGELVLSGSILKKDEYIRQGFISRIAAIFPEMSCIMPRNNAAYGAVLMALEFLKR